ncbi:unnamed protein product [Acanthoscelides obtectus]|uniref:Uncharacterized protein n=1 Tax=Acanthoscelides obtectus TaxID=200917 RepID=A0A9P0KB54_ACAOB|nr:unnamed protein product [Acanthoscelides obtectus]CAK1651880.1 hypothetical protein AOBTE_LOCUS17515 [Acanthoscelides obtectus]
MIWIGRNSLDFAQTLDSAIWIVNYIKSSALNNRLFTLSWLSKGNMLARLYELK